MGDRDAARLLALARLGIGLAGFLMPATFARLWTGRRQDPFPTNMVTRGLATRDMVLGAGALVALEGDGSAKRWLQACAIADVGDAMGTIGSFRELGGLRASGLLTVEVGAAVWGLMLADSLDR